MLYVYMMVVADSGMILSSEDQQAVATELKMKLKMKPKMHYLEIRLLKKLNVNTPGTRVGSGFRSRMLAVKTL